ncbi:MAG: transporter [Rhodobacterales bacterium 32-66-7]|nr:MAG: transporter [Rhodobacterales bacterium 32-66-7]
MTLAALATVWFVHLLAAASPGPAILMAARTGVTQGFVTGMWLSLGIGVGALVWAVAALFGMATLFHLAPSLLWAFKIGGGLFLLWIAFQMWRHAPEPLEMPTEATPATPFAAFRLGVLTQLANPKPAVFFGAVFVNTIPAGTSLPWIGVILILVLLNELACTLAVARAFSLAGPRSTYQRFKLYIDRSFGGLLALLGLKIAAT